MSQKQHRRPEQFHCAVPVGLLSLDTAMAFQWLSSFRIHFGLGNRSGSIPNLLGFGVFACCRSARRGAGGHADSNAPCLFFYFLPRRPWIPVSGPFPIFKFASGFEIAPRAHGNRSTMMLLCFWPLFLAFVFGFFFALKSR